MKPIIALLGSVLLLAFVGGCKADAVNVGAVTAAAPVPLIIKTKTSTIQMLVEVARTEAEQERGLMFRKSLPKDGGMIFPMVPPRIASFWMKNTVLPLDIVFIRTDGTIARITADAIPYSLQPMDSGEPVASVLEIAGGKAAAMGIAEGDRVTWQMP